MIRVKARNPPASFAANVHAPGQAYLLAHPVAVKKEKWEAHWRNSIPDLRMNYKDICAYYGCHVAETTGAATVDHYLPKSKNRAQAYDWSNFRLACSRMNARKHNGTNIIDPFAVVDGWFVLEFGPMTVHPAPALAPPTRASVLHTRDKLDLNSSECVRERTRLWNNYAVNEDSVTSLYTHAPFVALEAVRQHKLRSGDTHVTLTTIRTWLDS